MLHFPSTLKTAGPNGLPGRSDSLNATQQKAASHQIFLTIEEELHDARRVHSHGQEEDLRLALDMVINRVSELSSLLSEAYKSHADLEVQLNVAKSNLQLVISNNEMLEEALKRDSSGHSKDVGWRRWGAREGEYREQRISEERPHGIDCAFPTDGTSANTVVINAASSPASSAGSPGARSASFASQTPPTIQDNRFFKFRFTSGSAIPPRGKTPTSRPGTPSSVQSPNLAPSNGIHPNLTSASLPSLAAPANKELEELNAELERERDARKTVSKEKAALEAEIESLSQALFEEANKMVATERIKRAETEAELKESRQEKEALRSALRLIEGENMHLRGSSTDAQPMESNSASVSSLSLSHSRTSSRVAVKSPPSSPSHSPTTSLTSAPLPSSPHYESSSATAPPPSQPLNSLEEDELELTPQSDVSHPPPPPASAEEQEASPWADVPSAASPPSSQPEPQHPDSLFSAATLLSMR